MFSANVQSFPVPPPVFPGHPALFPCKNRPSALSTVKNRPSALSTVKTDPPHFPQAKTDPPAAQAKPCCQRIRHLLFERSPSSLQTGEVDRYLSPESGSKATIVLPLFSGLAARMAAAFNAAPEEIPTRIPSLRANALPSVNASSFSIVITSSYTLVLSTSGTNPAPIPRILCAPGVPLDNTGLVAGSTATILTFGFFSFKYSPTPVTVPPVPTPATKISTLPSVCSPDLRSCGCLVCCRVCRVHELS